MTDIKAGIVVVSKFITSGNKVFQGYIDYIDRDEAVRSDNYFKFDAYANYMDNPKKTVSPNMPQEDATDSQLGKRPEQTSALFTQANDFLTAEQKQEMKRLFKQAQTNGSPMWQEVISFDNRFLEKHGIYSGNPPSLDEGKMRSLTRMTMQEKFKNEGMVGSGIWSASIHYNTDNIHIHIASVEPNPTRKIMEHNGVKQYRGKLKPKTLDNMKSKVINNIVDRSEQLKEINDLIRENIVGATPKIMNTEDNELLKKFKEIYKRLPPDKRLWQYKMEGIKEVRPLLDDFTKTYIEHYYKADFKKLNEKLAEQQLFLKEAYGTSGKNTQYQDSKMSEVYTRVGNLVLKQLTAYDYAKNQKLSTAHQGGHAVKTTTRNHIGVTMQLKREFNKGFYELKKAISKDFSKIKFQRDHEKMMEDIEMEK